MSITDLIKVATSEFEAKMNEFGKNLDTRLLTADLAEQVCHGLQESLSSAARVAFKDFLERYDLHEPTLQVEGQKLRLKRISPKTFLTPFGLIEVCRSLYQADHGGPAYIPLDHFWEMNGCFATLHVREAINFAMAHMTAQECSKLFNLCSLFKPSSTAITHIVNRVSDVVADNCQFIETYIQSHIEIPQETRVMVTSIDGVNVLLREPGAQRGRPAERPGVAEDTKKNSCYKNAMVGTVSFYGDVPEGHVCPQRLSSIAMARMPQEGAVTFKEKLEQQLDQLESNIGSRVTKIFLSDGHRTLWNYADSNERFDHYKKLIDFYHTEEHLSKAAAALFGQRSAKAKLWYNTYRAKLLEHQDGASAVIRSMLYYKNTLKLGTSRQKDLAQEQTFFRRNKHRMSYAEFRVRGWPIGSGPVEAACKSIVKTRLCRRGMRWLREGGQRILDLRCYAKSALWDAFWQAYTMCSKSA